MSQSTDPSNFFQTSESLVEQERKATKARNNNGDPIRLPSKVLALISDPENENIVYVSESGGTVRRIDLNTRSTKDTFTGPSSPLPCLALSTPTSSIYAGCWDRNIYSWNTNTCVPGLTIRDAHGDFIKTLLCHCLSSLTDASNNPLSILISGGADRAINIWNAATGERLLLLRGHTMGVLDLALHPRSPMTPESQVSEASLNRAAETTFYSAGSDRQIRRWTITITRSSDGAPRASESRTSALVDGNDGILTPLPTSINALLFLPAGSAAQISSDEWTSWPMLDMHAAVDLAASSASGDIVILSKHGTVTNPWKEARRFSHGENSSVRAIAASPTGDILVSAGRNEDIWVWDIDSGESIGRWRGHADEVMGVIWLAEGQGTGKRQRLVSGGLDGTVRVWTMGLNGRRGSKGWIEGEVKSHSRNELNTNDEGEQADRMKVELTEEEEAELAELMDSD